MEGQEMAGRMETIMSVVKRKQSNRVVHMIIR